MEPPASAHLLWIYVADDEPIARELLVRASVLELQGLVRNDQMSGSARGLADMLHPGEALAERWRYVDVVLLLCSHAFLEGEAWRLALALFDRAGVRVVPILLSATTLPAALASMQMLPRDGAPLLGREDREHALLGVIQAVQELVMFRQRPDAVPEAQPLVAPALRIEDVFPYAYPPTLTFVEPQMFDLLKHRLGVMGMGMIVEGPPKVGKSTAIQKAMAALGIAGRDQIWLSGRAPPSLEEFQRVLEGLIHAQRYTWLFIDDFHCLEDPRYLIPLTATMKVLAELPQRRAKITLSGIKPVGQSLMRWVPELTGRLHVVQIDIEADLEGSIKIATLIGRGELAANLRFKHRNEIVVAAGGSYFLAQYLCNMASTKSGIVSAPREVIEIRLGMAEVIAAIQGELATQYRAALIDFATFDDASPPRGAMLSLLWLLSRTADNVVRIRDARLKFPMLNTSFDWLVGEKLAHCIEANATLKRLLYYNLVDETLTMEDPQLRFYLRALDWAELASASGHGRVQFHPGDGPLWSTVRAGTIALPRTVAPPRRHARRLLHLSDLHFASAEQVSLSYAQLRADLREQQVEAIDALVITGDLVNRASGDDYAAARLFLEMVMSGLSLSARQIVLVPGNHDVSWTESEDAYHLHRRARFPGKLVAGAYIEREGGLIEVREEDAYRRRFLAFSELYQAIKGIPYPLAYEEQGVIDDPEAGIRVLSLNSAWNLDHHFRERVSIHREALARSLLTLRPTTPDQLLIAAFHHPVHSDEEARIRDPGFLPLLAAHGFRLALHGHVHKGSAELYRYDHIEEGRQIEVVAAGTFGAATRDWVPGYPLQYNLLTIDDDEIIVETRCRREVNGAWEPDARWRQGPGKDPLPRYKIKR